MDTQASRYRFSLSTELFPVAEYPENGEMDNPRGTKYGERITVMAEADDGARWENRAIVHYTGCWESKDLFNQKAAEEGVDAIQLVDRGPDLGLLKSLVSRLNRGSDNLNPEIWKEIDPSYGSPAYIRSDTESVWAAEERREASYGIS